MSRWSRLTIGARVSLSLLASSALVLPLASTPLSTPASAYACTKAKIGGKSKCIAAGQFCAKRYEKTYNKYSFTCDKKDARGNWHLEAL